MRKIAAFMAHFMGSTFKMSSKFKLEGRNLYKIYTNTIDNFNKNRLRSLLKNKDFHILFYGVINMDAYVDFIN